MSGRGIVFSYTIVHHPGSAALREHVPYNVVVVELPDAGGARLVSNLVGIAPEDIYIGMPVTVIWEEGAEGFVLPHFKLAG